VKTVRLSLAAAAFSAASLFAGCTVDKEAERAPGPLVVWLREDPEAKTAIKVLTDRFQKREGIKVELSFKLDYEIESALGGGGVIPDLVELDLFQLQEWAKKMDDCSASYRYTGSLANFYGESVDAGKYEAEQKYMPFRLSWPALGVKRTVTGDTGAWGDFNGAARRNAGSLVIPSLDEKRFFAVMCSYIWSFGGTPEDPDSRGMQIAFSWLSNMSKWIHLDSGKMGPGDLADWPDESLPALFIAWPESLAPLTIKGVFQFSHRTAPFPCRNRRDCAICMMGSYLGIPKGSKHPEDAARFIGHLLSAQSQRSLVFTSSWLPVRRDGWGDLGPRKEEYEALVVRGDALKKPPPGAKKLVRPLSELAGEVLFHGKDPEEALAEYKERIK